MKKTHIVYLYPLVNGEMKKLRRWIPIQTAVLENYLNQYCEEMESTHYDLETEVTCHPEYVVRYQERYKELCRFLQMASIAQCVRGDHPFGPFFDDICELFPSEPIHFYCFSCISRDPISIKSVLLFMRHLKKKEPEAKTIMGGFYGYGDSLVDRCVGKDFSLASLPFVDYFVPKFGEKPLLRIISKWKQGRSVVDTDLQQGVDKEVLDRAFPELTHFHNKEYFQESPFDIYKRYSRKKRVPVPFRDPQKTVFLIPYYFQIGCFHGRCGYCGNNRREKNENPFFVKDIGVIIRDLQKLKEQHSSNKFIFLNSNFNFDLGFSKKLLRRMIDERLNILWSDSFNLENIDEELIDLLVRAGCYRLDIGIVSFCEEALRRVHNVITDLAVLMWLERLSLANLWVHINTISTIPHDYDIRLCAPLIRRHLSFIDSYVVNYFRLYRSEMAFSPDKFGVVLLPEHKQKFVEKEFEGTVDQRYAITQKHFKQTKKIFSRIGSEWHAFNDLYLLAYLYEYFGFAQKNTIRKTALSLLREQRRGIFVEKVRGE